MGTITKDLGIATAYGYAVSKGYTGTEEEFATLMASYATVAEEAAESASEAAESASAASTSATSAAESATSASASATSAGTAAETATTKAGEASASASTASTAATTATMKAEEARTSAANASTAATTAESAQTAAETAQGKAEAAQEAAEEAAASLVLDTTLTQPNQAAESKAVGDALVNKAPIILASASGSIASFPDGADDLPVENLVVNIEPKQSGSGDPSPTNVRPITGWDGCEVVRCGKNLIIYPYKSTPSTISGVTFSVASDGKITASGTTTAGVNFYLTDTTATHILVLKPGTYTVSIRGAHVGVNLILRDPINSEYITRINGADDEGSSSTFSITRDTVCNVYLNQSAAGREISVSAYIQLELNSNETDYEQYHGSTYPISWVTTSGTVYGGRVNVTTGELVVDRAMVDLGTLTWAKQSGISIAIFTARIDDKALGVTNVVCSQYLTTSVTAWSESKPDDSICGSSSSNLIAIRDESYTTAADFKTAMSGVQLVYELATPLTYQLTPVQVRTLLGQNNVWADCGDTEVEYRADTKLYIERLTQPTEDDMIADHAIASGAFFMIGNNLYRATAAVASGATIIVGTNATKLSLADALNALS